MMMKKAQVIPLPTKEGNTDHQLCNIDGEWAIGRWIKDVTSDEHVTFYHLYFTTKEEIGNEEYCYNYKRNTIEFTRIMKDTCEWVFCKKVIATTNPDLWIPRLIPDAEVPLPVPIAKIPTDFMEAYEREQGKITEVMLEYYNDFPEDSLEPFGPKLRSNGTVIIHKVDNQEKIWRDVFQLFADNMIKEKRYTQQEWLEICQKNWTIKEK